MSNNDPTAASWDAYWQGAQKGAAFSAGGTSHPLVLSFWDDFFQSINASYPAPKLIDIASGSGAVVERARAAFDDEIATFTCLDISVSAIDAIQLRFPKVIGVVADARSIPLNSAAYDIATSQFGIEYAGLEAVDEVARLVAPGGRLAFLLHHKAGGIYRQCSASLDAIRKMQQVDFIAKCIAMFEAGFATRQGTGKEKYEAAAKRFVPAIRALEAIMKQHGPEVADGTVVRLYKDVRAVHSRMAHYEPGEVLGWLQRMQLEIEAFGGRMASMCDAAITKAEFSQLSESLQQQGFELLRHGPLELADAGPPLAWALIATRP